MRKGSVAFLILIAMGLVGLEIFVQEKVISPALYASPSEIIASAPYLIIELGYWRDMTITTIRAVVSLLIGFPLGLIIAFSIYSLREARALGEFLLDFIRSIPVTALVPLFIAIYGIGERNKIAIGAFSVLLITSITVLVGIKEEEKNFGPILHLYSPQPSKRYILVIFPYILPSIAGSLRLAVSSAMVLVIVAEMFIGTNAGIGKAINDLTYTDKRPAQFLAIILTGVLGYLINRLADWVRYWTLKKTKLGL